MSAPVAQRRLLVPWPVDPWVGTGADMGGLGDAIEACDLIPYVAPHCPDTTLAVRRPLVRLFSRLGFPVVAYRDIDPATYDSVGSSLTAGVESLRFPRVRARPPLWVDDTLKVERDEGLLVGLCWHGSGGGRSAIELDDDYRCVPPAELRPLIAVPGISWLGLQLADHARELPIKGLDTLGVRDFADTAGIMQQLDLIITIDTSVVHLAGQLQLPTWLLLSLPNYDQGRWDCVPPAYPTVRQFRQPHRGDWSSVIGTVLEELLKRAAQTKNANMMDPVRSSSAPTSSGSTSGSGNRTLEESRG